MVNFRSKTKCSSLLMENDVNFSVTPEQTKTDCSINPVKQLWEWKGIRFPGKGVLSTWNQGESKKVLLEL